MLDQLKNALERILVPVLRPALDPFHEFLNQLPPWSWTLAVCLLLMVGTLWSLLLPKQYIYRGAPSDAWWRDLRWWVVVLLVPYLLVYLLF